MKTDTIGGRKVTYYEGIDELPIVNYQKFNKYLLIDSGIGSDVNDIDAHIVRIARLIKSSPDKAMVELDNMRSNLFMAVSGISPKMMAFAALIHDIDGDIVQDLSDESAKKIIALLSKERFSVIRDLCESLKKKIRRRA